MKFSDLTYHEIKGLIQKSALAVLPTGCTEQQGLHLPVDFDTWLAERISIAAAERLEAQTGNPVLVLPAMPYGPTPEHRNFGSGFIDLPQPLHEAVIEAVLESLAAQGFQRIVIWRGCGQHELKNVVGRFNVVHMGDCRVFQPNLPYQEIWCRVGDAAVPGGHADSFVTSLALFLRPDAVRQDLIINPKNDEVNWDDPNLDFTHHSTTGVIGDPTHATADLGQQLWVELQDTVAEIFGQVIQQALI
jgi:creatinine amidohydrolase